MKKEVFEKLINLYEEIDRIEKMIFPNEFLEGGFVHFEKLRDNFWNLYSEYEDSKTEITLLEAYKDIMETMTYFDFSLLTPEQIKSLTKKVKKGTVSFVNGELVTNGNDKEEEVISILSSDEKNYPNAIRTFKDKNEVIDFVLTFDN